MFGLNLKAQIAIIVMTLIVILLLFRTGTSATPESQFEQLRSTENLLYSDALAAINDKALRKCLHKTLWDVHSKNKQQAWAAKDLDAIKHVYCRNVAIRSLNGICALKNLEFLDLSKNDIGSTTELKSCHKLKFLHLSGNPLTQINGLKALNNLERVTLPKLPKLKCDFIARVLPTENVNLHNTDCIKAHKALPTAATSPKTEDKNKYSLSGAEEAELLEFELQRRL